MYCQFCGHIMGDTRQCSNCGKNIKPSKLFFGFLIGFATSALMFMLLSFMKQLPFTSFFNAFNSSITTLDDTLPIEKKYRPPLYKDTTYIKYGAAKDVNLIEKDNYTIGFSYSESYNIENEEESFNPWFKNGADYITQKEIAVLDAKNAMSYFLSQFNPVIESELEHTLYSTAEINIMKWEDVYFEYEDFYLVVQFTENKLFLTFKYDY